MPEPQYMTVDVFIAWNDAGEYVVGPTAEEALEQIASGDGQLTRVAKLGPVTLPLPQIEDGNGLLPPGGPRLKVVA